MNMYTETVGYIIHQRNFKDSSLIIEFFSKDFGKIQLIAKGIKKNKKLKPQIQPFSSLKIQYFGKSQLKTLTAINVITQQNFVGITERTAGLYLNELLHYSLIENEKSTAIFQTYQESLSKLGRQKLTPLLRAFEREILQYSGFGLSVESFKNQDTWLTIDDHMGLIEVKNNQGFCMVNDLTKFLDNRKLNSPEQKRINTFMQKAIDMSISHKRLYSRELLKSIFSQKTQLRSFE